MMSEQEILILYKKDRRKALKNLHGLYADVCYMVAKRYLRNNEDAEEIVMDTFLIAFEKLQEFQWSHEGSVRAWLKKVTVNNCLMKLRKKRLVFEEEISIEFEKEDELVFSNLQYHEIVKAVQSLPQQYSLVFQLHEVDGFSHPEIAILLGLSPGSSKAYLNRARTSLKEILIPLGYKYE
jgi:RNA polymerase sigma factor (sigma-70 family)